jgi:predicted dehydrogenase
VETSSDAHALVKNPKVDAVAIATPVASHYSLAKAALENGKHVFVEKPLAQTAAQAQELVELARKHRRMLMVDHVFVYHAPVRKIKELITKGELGDLLYFDSVRINLGLFQSDVNVVWDLAPHDLSIMDYLVDHEPIAVRAVGARHAHTDFENIAYIHFHFKNDFVAHFHVNWLAPVKIRQILIGGTRRMVVFNDIEPTEKIKIYDKGVDVRTDSTESGRFQTLINYRSGDMLAPNLEMVEALQLACRDFVGRATSGQTEFGCDGTHGARIVQYIEAIQKSVALRGELVSLEGPRPIVRQPQPSL